MISKLNTAKREVDIAAGYYEDDNEELREL